MILIYLFLYLCNYKSALKYASLAVVTGPEFLKGYLSVCRQDINTPAIVCNSESKSKLYGSDIRFLTEMFHQNKLPRQINILPGHSNLFAISVKVFSCQ